MQERPLVQVLGADGGELRGIADPGPRGRRLGGLEAPLPRGGRGVRDAQVLLHGAQDLIGQRRSQAPDLAVVGADHGVLGLAVDERELDGQGGDPQQDLGVDHDADGGEGQRKPYQSLGSRHGSPAHPGLGRWGWAGRVAGGAQGKTL